MDILGPADSDVLAALIEHWRQRTQKATEVSLSATITALTGSLTTRAIPAAEMSLNEEMPPPDLLRPGVLAYPTVLVQAAVVRLGEETNEGQLVDGVSVAWFEIIKELQKDPDFLFKIHWRKLEELIAGAYEREGWPEVVLTPRSGDRGRDVIASKPGIGAIRIVDQIKAYSPGRRVSADEVRSLLGVLTIDRNVSKGIITTSSEFAPGIFEDADLKAFMPHRVELKDGQALRKWLIDLSEKSSARR